MRNIITLHSLYDNIHYQLSQPKALDVTCIADFILMLIVFRS